jgi:hypothetical protein
MSTSVINFGSKAETTTFVSATQLTASRRKHLLRDEMKLVPFTVNVKAAEPATTEVGDSVVMVGTGLLGAATARFTELDVPPPGVVSVTVTGAVPAVATSPARMEMLSCVKLT